MKAFTILIITAISFSSCIVEMELDPPYVNVGQINEYETKEIIKEVWSGGVLIYEESIYHAWLDVEFYNSGGLTADNVWAEIQFFKNSREIHTISVHLPNIRSGHKLTYNLDTGFESIYDYSDFEVNVYWE